MLPNFDKQKAYFGLEFEELENGKIELRQISIPSGRILNKKQLVSLGKIYFPNIKIEPKVFCLKTAMLNLDWIQKKMNLYDLRPQDVASNLGIPKENFIQIIKGETSLTNKVKSLLFYYFLTFELNKEMGQFLKLEE